MLFDQSDPIGMERLDAACASVSHTIASVHRGKSGKRYKVSDFMLKYGRPKKQKMNQMLAVMTQARQRIGGQLGNNGN